MRLSRVVLFVVLLVTLPGPVYAEILREGTWPEDDPKVSLDAQQVTRSEALKRLAEAAGLSIVVESPSADLVDVQVRDQSATKVLELLLSDRTYRVRRDGTLLHVRPVTEPQAGGVAASPPPATAVAPVPPPPPVPPIAPSPPPMKPEVEPPDPTKSGEDRMVAGGRARIEKHETVGDLMVMGGGAEVFGHVTGDLMVMGGSATLRKGARVDGDAMVLGGSLNIEDEARVAGEVAAIGGSVHRAEGAEVGKISSAMKTTVTEGRSILNEIGRAVTRTALLFVFGAVLLALATGRMEQMEREVAARPMRTFALGVVGVLVATIAFIVLCITLIGIPLAAIGALVGAFATYVGIAAVLTTLGGALIHHKTDNAYAHLAVGCAVYLVLSSLPWVGGLVTFVMVMFGIGAIVATRGAGYVRKRSDQGPYRTAHP